MIRKEREANRPRPGLRQSLKVGSADKLSRPVRQGGVEICVTGYLDIVALSTRCAYAGKDISLQ